MEQRFAYPRDLFSTETPPEAGQWACVRVRSRAEKKFSEWLSGRQAPHYLPVLQQDTVSHRRLRQIELPLFPGYVFVAGDPSKGDFKHSGAVVDVLPSNATQRMQLPEQLWSLWKGLTSGSPLELVDALRPGQLVEVVAGSLKGTRGRFERWGKHGRLVLWVDMLGAGAAIEIDGTSVIRAV